MSAVLAGSDLDRTIIYSRNALALAPEDRPELECVEIYLEEPASFMTAAAAALAAGLAELVTLVPVTTRTPAQLGRVVLPGRSPAFGIASNGGALMVDGIRDADWDRRVSGRLEQVAPLSEIWNYAAQVCSPDWTASIRNADGLFCYAVIDRAAVPDGLFDEARAWAQRRGWTTSLQGRKLYWMPSPLSKAAALLELADRIAAETILTAGDSLLDRDLLECADRSIRPRHGELFESDWSYPGTVMTARSGVRAGEEILQWFTDTALAAM